MFKKLSLAGAALVMSASAIVPTAPAAAHPQDRYNSYSYDRSDDSDYRDDYRDQRAYNQRAYQQRAYEQRAYEQRAYNQRAYDQRAYDQRGYEQQRGYQNRQYYSQRNPCDTTRGTVLGAIAGGLLGNVIAGHGDRTLGTVLGAGGGALAGRAIQKDGQRYTCR